MAGDGESEPPTGGDHQRGGEEQPERWQPPPGFLAGLYAAEQERPRTDDDATAPTATGTPPSSALDATGVIPTVAPPRPAAPSPPAAPPPWPPASPDATDPGASNPPDQRRRSLFIAAGVLAVLAVIVVATALVLRNDDDPDPTPPPSSTTTEATTTSLPTSFGLVDLGSGVQAIVPEGALSPGSTLRGAPAGLPDGSGALVAASPVLDITVDGGTQQGPITLVFPVEDPSAATPPGGDAPIVLGLHDADGTVARADGTFDPAANTFTVQAESLSRWAVVTWDWDRVTSAAEEVTTALVDGPGPEVAQPTCTAPAPSELVSSSGGDDLLLSCVDLDADGSRTIRVANPQNYALILTGSDGTTAERGENGSLPGALTQWLRVEAGSGVVALAPGESAAFTVPPGQDGSVATAYEGAAHAATSLLVAVDVIRSDTALVPLFGEPPAAATVLDRIGAGGCLDRTGRSSATDAVLVADLVTTCFGAEALGGATSPTVSAFLAPVLADQAVLDAITSEVDSSLISLRFDAETTIEVAAPDEPEPDEDDEPGPDELAWPIDDFEGDAAYLAWLGSGLVFPDWTSCGKDVCIAGSGDTVFVTALDPLEDVGTIPLASTDPLGDLQDLGIKRRDATAALEPGPR